MRQKFTILFILVFILSFILFLWWNQAVKPADPTNKNSLTFIVKKGENARTIAERLQKQGLIRSSVAFFLLARFTDFATNIQAGQFSLSPSLDMNTIASSLTRGTMDIRITIPEGWRSEEIALKLAQELSIPEAEFLKVAREGYMFPDTYFLPKDASAGAIAKIMHDNFQNKVSQIAERKSLPKGLTLNEVVIIASLVEREAKLDEDRPMVASVILNRLNLGMKLDIDATIQYALGYQAKEKSWWKKELTLEDLGIISAYNTYKNNGLPPASISNPGLASLKSAIDAPETNYLYYISDKSGKIHFAQDIKEHNVNIAKYLNK